MTTKASCTSPTDNISIKDSKLLYNVGNRYLCMWRVPVDGLEIRGNIIRTARRARPAGRRPSPSWGANTGVRNEPLSIKNLQIIDNVTDGTGIHVRGINEGNIVIRGNRHAGPEPGSLHVLMVSNEAVSVEDNTNYTVSQSEHRR